MGSLASILKKGTKIYLQLRKKTKKEQKRPKNLGELKFGKNESLGHPEGRKPLTRGLRKKGFRASLKKNFPEFFEKWNNPGFSLMADTRIGKNVVVVIGIPFLVVEEKVGAPRQSKPFFEPRNLDDNFHEPKILSLKGEKIKKR